MKKEWLEVSYTCREGRDRSPDGNNSTKIPSGKKFPHLDSERDGKEEERGGFFKMNGGARNKGPSDDLEGAKRKDVKIWRKGD